jgi:hypothetical protein
LLGVLLPTHAQLQPLLQQPVPLRPVLLLLPLQLLQPFQGHQHLHEFELLARQGGPQGTCLVLLLLLLHQLQ